MPVTQLGVMSVPVSDQDRSKKFYAEVLGFDVVADTPFVNAQRWVQLRPPQGGTSITLVTWFDAMPPGTLQGAVLECTDVESTYTDLQDRGLQFNGGITKEFWGTFTTFNDPDGNGWVLAESDG